MGLIPARRPDAARGGETGLALADVLIGISVLGIGAAAAMTLLIGNAARVRTAALEGGRAEAAMRVADGLRSGTIHGDSGTVVVTVGRSEFEAGFARSDDSVAGALRIVVTPVSGGGTLSLDFARLVPLPP